MKAFPLVAAAALSLMSSQSWGGEAPPAPEPVKACCKQCKKGCTCTDACACPSGGKDCEKANACACKK